MKLDGKAAVITGGGTGVGRATALGLARRGCSVLVNYSRSADEAEQTAAEVRALGVKGIAIRADVSDDAACRGMMAAAVRELGRLDVLVQSAGTTVFIPHNDLDAVKDEDWSRLFKVNVQGAFQCARAAKAAMLASGDGEIVNTVKAARERKAVLGKVSDPEDIAEAILSLIAGSDLVTGQVLVCDGGTHLAP